LATEEHKPSERKELRIDVMGVKMIKELDIMFLKKFGK